MAGKGDCTGASEQIARKQARASGHPPLYAAMSREEFSERVSRAFGMLKECSLCPRACGVDRTEGQRGFCRTLDKPFVSSWGPHFGEEPPLVGPHNMKAGSGAIFFGNCNLGCIFCQNWTISHHRGGSDTAEGAEISTERLASIMLELQDAGCHNINLVTPTHQMPMILKALGAAKDRGLALPVVYNTGGYDSLEAVRLLSGIVDIYMPDFKYWDPEMAAKYSLARDYPETAKAAIREMHRQVGDLVIENGVAIRGLLLRHLVLPCGIAGTKDVVKFVSEEISKNTYINIMDQYHPCFKAFEHPPLDRRITEGEYEEAVRAATEAGLRRIAGVTVQ
ncbi:MAG: radical SAM protein [Thermodesulfovibrionales bacterium]|nr:radical SAM protein [Thermodesulfovibrionales bacterium]